MNWKTVSACLLALVVLVGCGPAPQSAPPPQQMATSSGKAPAPPEPTYPPDAVASLTRNFYFVLDGSGSMNDSPCSDDKSAKSFSTKLDAAKWAIGELMKSVPKDANLGLWIFDNYGQREAVPLGPNNRAKFVQEVNKSASGNGTPLYEAIEHGVNALAAQRDKQLGYGDFRLVVVTDGEAYYLDDAGQIALKQKVPIYTIGFCLEKDHALRKYSVSYQAANSPAALAQGLKDALAEATNFDAGAFEALKQ